MIKMVISFDRREPFIMKVYRALSIVGSILCVFLAIINNVQFNLWILPVTYSIGIILLSDNNVVKLTPGIIVLNTIMFCRYMILPLIMSINNGNISVYAIQYGRMNEAIIIMWVELIGLLSAIYFTGICFKRKINKTEYLDSSLYSCEMKYGSVICIIGVLVIVVMIMRFPHLIGGFELLTQGFLTETVDISDVSGVVGIIWKSFTSWMAIYFLYALKKKNLTGSTLTIFLLFGMALVVLISFIGQVTISRWYSVVTFVALYFSVVKMFPQKSKIIMKCTIIPATICLLITSVYKNTAYLTDGGRVITYINELFDISMLDSYFAGPVSVNNALYLKARMPFGFTAIFYDALRNFPVLNHYIHIEHSTVEMYHAYLGRGDMILPLVGQSMIYFGYVFTPLLSIISVILVRYFDNQYLKSISLSMYIYAFTACWLALATILNFTVCISWFYSIIVPLFLLIKFTEMTGIRSVKNGLI